MSEGGFEEHVRLNPDLVRTSESDLRELARHGGEAAAANELRRRKWLRENPVAERTYGVYFTQEELIELQELVGEQPEEMAWTGGAYSKLGRVIANVMRERRSEAQADKPVPECREQR